MKASELTGPALRWAVAKIEGHQSRCAWMIKEGWVSWQSYEAAWGNPIPNYDEDWEQAGPIIEREKIAICWLGVGLWRTSIEGTTDAGIPLYDERGPTPLIAAMRCYVASKLGDEVEIPEELT
jgi:hypothetical protein